MADRHFPVRPNLEQLKHQAKDLLRTLKQGEPVAIAELEKHCPGRFGVREIKLADAQRALARSYGLTSWSRLVIACKMTDAIWRDDVDAVREMVLRQPQLLAENARGTEHSHWGPPMSYAANLGRDGIVTMLRELGAADLSSALDRAVLQGKVDTARLLYQMGARPPRGAVMGPAETQNGAGMAYLLALGAEICDAAGDRLAPVALLLQTYCRNPEGKHQCLELFSEHGVALGDTPVMALHCGRIDLLEKHLALDPGMLGRTFSHEEIYPPEIGCHVDRSLALNGTPLEGTTLLHMCVDFIEFEMAKWLIEHGSDVNARAEVDADGFGGHTALFGCVVTASGAPKNDDLARLLLDHGADPNVRASLRKRIRFVGDESTHEYQEVTPISWGERFHEQNLFVNHAAMRLIAERGGCG